MFGTPSRPQYNPEFDKSLSSRNLVPGNLSSFSYTKKILEPSYSFNNLETGDDDTKSTKSIAGGFKERRFKLKMEKLKKLYLKQTSTDLNSHISGKRSRLGSVEQDKDSEDQQVVGSDNRASLPGLESIIFSKKKFDRKNDIQSATSSNVGTVESEFKRNMGLGSAPSEQSVKVPSRRERHIHFSS